MGSFPLYTNTSGTLAFGATSHEITVDVPSAGEGDWYTGVLEQNNKDPGSGSSSTFQFLGTIGSVTASGLVVQLRNSLTGVWNRLADLDNYSGSSLSSPGQIWRMGRTQWQFRIANQFGSAITKSWTNFSFGLRDSTGQGSPVCFPFDSGFASLTSSPQQIIGNTAIDSYAPFGSSVFGMYWTIETTSPGSNITPVYWRRSLTGVWTGPFNLSNHGAFLPGEFVPGGNSNFPFNPLASSGFVFGASWTGGAPANQIRIKGAFVGTCGSLVELDIPTNASPARLSWGAPSNNGLGLQSYSLAGTDGLLYSWGYGGLQQHGDGSTADSLTPKTRSGALPVGGGAYAQGMQIILGRVPLPVIDTEPPEPPVSNLSMAKIYFVGV